MAAGQAPGGRLIVFARLFVLFTVTTTLELVLLLVVGRYVGLLPTIGGIVVTGLLGALLASREGRRAWSRVGESMRRGELPADPIVQALLVLAGGLLLLTPGLLTDATGFACLIPVSRGWIARRVRGYLAGRLQLRMGGEAVRGGPRSTRRDRDREEPGAQRDGARVFDATDQQ